MSIYGLPDYHDVSNMVNRLFHDINLTVKCKSAYRTPTRAHGNRVGVVIAELYSIEDKRSALERKRNLRTIPIYANVFIRAAKSHTDQVMESNFGVILSEMTNGEAFHISDNGRIPRTSRNHGGARQKTTRYNSHAILTKYTSIHQQKHQRYISELPPYDFTWHQSHGPTETQQ